MSSLCKSAHTHVPLRDRHTHGNASFLPKVKLRVSVLPCLNGFLLSYNCAQQVKCMLVLHLISAACATAALGLMSKHLPYRQDSYHCEHCRRLELHAVVFWFS